MKRNARILAELASYGATSDAFHITQPSQDGEGGAKAMQMALRKAGLTTKDIDYINAHGTSTSMNDKCETMAIKSVFGDDAYRVPVSSTKSQVGHCLGASGAVEATATILALQEQMIPPTVHLDEPDPECDLDHVPNTARKQDIRIAMSNSFAFGGNNTAILFGKGEQ